uniref:AAA+ ATPase domain-containing protein n=1 Tax=candidate division WOR-3 bacterium TaxID=2052148 RepID=A0A7C4GIH2_UNCW3
MEATGRPGAGELAAGDNVQGVAGRRRVVSHPVFGEGEILDSRGRGSELLVRFQSGLRLWLAAGRVRRISQLDDSLLEDAAPAIRAIDRIQARRMVEAFRLGIVPHQDVETFTFGRDAQVKTVVQALAKLESGQGDVFIVEGEYGTGKTHLLEFLHHRALASGVVASMVQLDPVEVTPDRPKRVYRELVHNLRFIRDGRECGFRDLMTAALELDIADHVFFGPYLRKLRRLEPGNMQAEMFWQLAEGESTKEFALERRSPYRVRGAQRMPALYDFSTAADCYCYLISGLSYISRRLGHKGLVLLLDEAETVTGPGDVMRLTKSVNFMDGLVGTARNDAELKRLNPRMIHNQVRPVPYIYRDSFLLVVFATTPAPYDYAYLRLANRVDHRIALEPLGDKAMVDAFANLVAVYLRAYPGFAIAESEQRQVLQAAARHGADGVRAFLKFCVSALDVARWRQVPARPA